MPTPAPFLDVFYSLRKNEIFKKIIFLVPKLEKESKTLGERVDTGDSWLSVPASSIWHVARFSRVPSG